MLFQEFAAKLLNRAYTIVPWGIDQVAVPESLWQRIIGICSKGAWEPCESHKPVFRHEQLKWFPSF
jgi:hypothetical protein